MLRPIRAAPPQTERIRHRGAKPARLRQGWKSRQPGWPRRRDTPEEWGRPGPPDHRGHGECGQTPGTGLAAVVEPKEGISRAEQSVTGPARQLTEVGVAGSSHYFM